MSDDHKRGDRKGNFCSVPAADPCDDCPHKPDNYRKACKPTPLWSRPKFQQLIKYTSKPWETKPYPYEAHHILCVGSVTDQILGNVKIRTVVEQTQWCINGKINMIAMPLWGHTIQHYCDLEDVEYAYKIKESRWSSGVIEPSTVRFLDNATKPDFADIPMHNFGHNSKKGYKWETDVKLKHLAGKIAKSQKNHEEKKEEIKSRLNNLSKQFRDKLTERGIRTGGTHEAWQLGLKDRSSSTGWYKPFSMQIKPRPIPFPAKGGFSGEMGQKIKKLVQALHY